MATAKRQKAEDQAEKSYFIVNPAGAIHEVNYEHAKWRLSQVGYRVASKDEVAAYKATEMQTAKNPICKPWSPEPEPIEVEPDEA